MQSRQIDWDMLRDGVNARFGVEYEDVDDMLRYLRRTVGGLEKMSAYLGVGYGTLHRRWVKMERFCK